MAIFLLGPDPQGQCCDCANRINPCDSCAECSIELPASRIFDPDSTNAYGNLEQALSVVAELSFNDCRINADYGSFSVRSSFDNNRLIATQRWQAYGGSEQTSFYFKILATSTDFSLSVSVSSTATSSVARAQYEITDLSGNVIAFDNKLDSLEANIVLPEPGQYIFFISSASIGAQSSGIVDVNMILSSSAYTICPFKVAYYDSEGNIAFVTCSDLP